MTKTRSEIKPTSVEVSVGSNSGSITYSYPLEITNSRALTPTLALCYQNGQHNTFGYGWDLHGLLKISRVTHYGVPTYQDEADVFILSGSDKLVNIDTKIFQEWTVKLYQPRVKNNARSIEYFQHATDSTQNYWLVREINGINHIFGKTALTRITDSQDNNRIFSWLLEKSIDANGNVILYQYQKGEDNNSNQFIRSIYYGNTVAYSENPSQFVFEIRFCYQPFNLTTTSVEEYLQTEGYISSPAKLISYRSGFPIIKDRQCHSIALIHRFNEVDNGKSFLVKNWSFQYATTPKSALTQLSALQLHGFKKLSNGNYFSKSMPSLQFSYNNFLLEDAQQNEFQFGEQKLQFDGALIPASRSTFQFIDLYREGLPGVLYSDTRTTFYWRNKGDGHFQAPQLLAHFPINRSLSSYHNQLMDIPGTDQLALVVSREDYAGFYEQLSSADDKPEALEWRSFQTFAHYPSDFVNPGAELIDIRGTGLSDLVLFNAIHPIFYPALGREGYDQAEELRFPHDFPINNADPSQYVTFANLLGDGLMHRVRITNNSIEYWPNLGNGKFGSVIQLNQVTPICFDDFLIMSEFN